MSLSQSSSWRRSVIQYRILFSWAKLLCCFLMASLFALDERVNGQGAAESIGYRCALRLSVVGRGKSEDVGVRADEQQSGTAVLVKQPDSKSVYMVTAYHVIHQMRSADINARGGFRLKLDPSELTFDSRTVDFRPVVYLSNLADLAIFELTDARSSEIPTKDGSVVAVELGAVEPDKELDPSVGFTAVAVGNPKVDVFRPKNIVYSATVSEFARVGARIPEAVSRNVGAEVSNHQLIFLETLSITKGFSGGPVLVQGYGGGQRLAGIILGGNPNLQAGRFAYAATAADVEHGIRVLRDTTNSEVINPKFERKVPIKDFDWSTLPLAYADHGVYSFSSSVLYESGDQSALVIDNKKWDAICDMQKAERKNMGGGDLRLSESSEPGIIGVDFVFDRVTFDRVKFSGHDLSYSTFFNCTFIEPSFGGSVLTGASFRDCKFCVNPAAVSARSEQRLYLDYVGYQKPLMAFGVTVSNCSIEALSEDPLHPNLDCFQQSLIAVPEPPDGQSKSKDADTSGLGSSDVYQPNLKAFQGVQAVTPKPSGVEAVFPTNANGNPQQVINYFPFSTVVDIRY